MATARSRTSIYLSTRFLALSFGLKLDASEALSFALRLRFGFVPYNFSLTLPTVVGDGRSPRAEAA
jgi:hypothetical protein